MINWIEATPENIKKYFFNKETKNFNKILCKDFVFLTEDGINSAENPNYKRGALYLNKFFIKITHFCTTAEYELILPKKVE